jgi:hypothetical protein
MFVSRHGMFFGLFMLAMSVTMRGLKVMVGRSVMTRGSLVMMINGRVLVVFWHDSFPRARNEIGKALACCAVFGSHYRPPGYTTLS